MSTFSQVCCDACGKTTQSLGEHPAWDDKETSKNSWNLRLNNIWLESRDDTSGLLKLEWAEKINFDLCLACAEEIGNKILEWVKK